MTKIVCIASKSPSPSHPAAIHSQRREPERSGIVTIEFVFYVSLREIQSKCSE
jgi:hypothetical protein